MVMQQATEAADTGTVVGEETVGGEVGERATEGSEQRYCDGGETRHTAEDVGDDAFVFFGVVGTCRVEQKAVRGEAVGSGEEDTALTFCIAVHSGRAEATGVFETFAEQRLTAAGGIYQNEVEEFT